MAGKAAPPITTTGELYRQYSAVLEREKETRVRDRILSATVGGIFTALFMTPFDVVKIRLQVKNNEIPHIVVKYKERKKNFIYWTTNIYLRELPMQMQLPIRAQKEHNRSSSLRPTEKRFHIYDGSVEI